MRISGGVARGITLLVPKGDAVRPATDGLRQAVFSSLGGRTAGSRFLDLFAGSGAYGLEALSRGAAGGTFVERSHKAVACLRRNLEAVCKSLGRSEEGVAIREADVMHGPLHSGSEAPDLVFIDPPYEIIPEISESLFARLSELVPPGTGALVILEAPGGLEISPAGWTRIKQIGRGARQPTANFYEREPA